MPNLTSGTPPQAYGYGGRYVVLPQEASTQLWEGGMVALAADGGLVPATTAGAGHVVGLATFDQLSTSSSNSRQKIWTDKVFILNAGVYAPTDNTPFGTVLFAETDNTVGTGAGGETCIAGRFYGFEDDGRVRVYISSCASWFDANAAFTSAGLSTYKARAVVTSLAAYTGSTSGSLVASAAGALAAQDGVSVAVGDILFIQEGTTNLAAASDAGPWQVTALGSSTAKWAMVRPSWWATGATIAPGAKIDVGGEGAVFGGTEWKSFAAKGAVVDAVDPAFWVKLLTQQVTLVAGTKTIANVGVRSASLTQVVATRVIAGGTTSTTVMYGPSTGSTTGITAGAVGTGSVVIDAQVAAGTLQNADASVLNVSIINW